MPLEYQDYFIAATICYVFLLSLDIAILLKKRQSLSEASVIWFLVVSCFWPLVLLMMTSLAIGKIIKEIIK